MLYQSLDYPSPQAALDAAAADPGPVRPTVVLSGVHDLTEPLRVRGPMAVDASDFRGHCVGGNHRLLCNFDDSDAFGGYSGHGGISIRGGVWDAAGASASAGTVVNALGFAHASDIEVRNATVLNVAGAHAVEFGAIKGGRIRDCTFRGFHDTGGRAFSEAIQIDGAWSAASSSILDYDGTPCEDVSVSGCRMGASAELGPFGALIGGHAMSPDRYHRFVRVSDCHVESSLSFAYRPYGWEHSTIVGCTTDQTGGSAFLLQRCRYVAVSTVASDRAGSNGVSVQSSHMITVNGALIEDSGPNYGVWLGEVSPHGISTDVLISGNVIGGAAAAAVKLSGADRCVVSGNLIRRDAGGATGIVAAGGVGTANRAEDNDFDGFTTNLSNPSGTILTE